MVYAFNLPTTSHLTFQSYLSSSTHPSLPQAATTSRHALRIALKQHKRLPRGPQQEAHLSTVLTTLTNYLPHLAALTNGLNGRPIEGTSTSVEITQHSLPESEWRATLSPRTLTNSTRIRGHGLDFELAFVLSTLGYVLSALAHTSVIRTLYAPTTPSPEQRTAAIQTATKHLLNASAVHSFLATSPAFAATARAVVTGPSVPDLDQASQSALASLALAEATLLAVLKDDYYVAACIQARNPNDKEWMVSAPEIPKVRAHLFARLCIRAAEYADQSAAGLGSVGVDEDLVKYVRVLKRVARARACRFFGVDAELAGKIGEGVAWLRAAKGALGVRSAPEEVAKPRGFSRLKQGWMERREERRMEKDAGKLDMGELGPGDNAGREEEGRVLEMLETKWVRMNDTINTQLIPPSADLMANLPSGRDIHSAPTYRLPSLDEEQSTRMRAPPAEEDIRPGSDSEDEYPKSVPERTDSAYY